MKQDLYLSRNPALVPWLLAVTLTASGVLADTWHEAPGLFEGRQLHGASILLDGRILVVGGSGEAGVLQPTAELFDPASGRWEPTGSLRQARSTFTTTLLPSGKVLVVGGQGGLVELATAELYDPASGTWSDAGTIGEIRQDHTATLLASGEVLVVGGYGDSQYRSSVALYSPDRGWEVLPRTLKTARRWHTATLLPDGRVLVVGGKSKLLKEKRVELFDPTTGAWTSSADTNAPCDGTEPPHPAAPCSLHIARQEHTATLLHSGRVLVVGDTGGGASAQSVELYDPTSGVWTELSPTIYPYSRATATLLPSDRVLLVGDAGAETYHAAKSGSSSEEDPLASTRQKHTATLLPSGDVLVVGGLSSATPLTDASIYTVESPGDPLALSSSLAAGRDGHAATLLASGDVLVAGGRNGSGALESIEIYAPGVGWQTSPAGLEARSDLTVTLLSGNALGYVLVAGGLDGDVPSSTVELIGPDGGSLTSSNELPPDSCNSTSTPHPGTPCPLLTARGRHTATLLASGQVLVTGGRGADGDPLSSVELYDPETGLWTADPPLHEARRDHRATLLPSGRVLVTGGLNKASFMRSSVELYDPATHSWTTSTDTGFDLCAPGAAPHPSIPCPLSEGRSLHTATLLASGQVLVAGGGSDFADDLASTEAYDPDTGRWSVLQSLQQVRSEHSAVLLPSGKVLITGGTNDGAPQVELYDPASGAWTLESGAAAPARRRHTSTLLPSGDVLIVGGTGTATDNAHLFHPPANVESRRPNLESVSPTVLRYGDPFTVSGERFGGSEGGSGNTRQSAANHALVQLRAVSEGIQNWLTLGVSRFCSMSTSKVCARDGDCPAGETCELEPRPPLNLVVEALPPTFNPGWHLLTVLTEGMASKSKLVHLECSLGDIELAQEPSALPPPDEDKVAVGTTATFEARAAGGRTFQWQQCDGDPATTCAVAGDGWTDLPGATGTSYTTPLVTGPESGRRFRVKVATGCMSRTSQDVVLQVADATPPEGSVVTPDGGEYWLLSDAENVNTENVTWSMSDDVRICRVRVSLLGSADGADFVELPAPGGGLPVSFNGGSASLPCYFPGEGTTSTSFTLPADFTSLGGSGWQYKVQVQLTDHAGNETVVLSQEPFYIVRPNQEAVKSLILWNSERMAQAFGDVTGLERNLRVLASHPEVAGHLVDLSKVGGLECLYAWWDAPGESVEGCAEALRPCTGLDGPARETCLANSVLFDPDDPDVDDPRGVHPYLLDEVLPVFTGVEYLVLVGDDRFVPMARLKDQAQVLTEAAYPGGSDLSDTLTTVGRALANGQFLSDDPLAVRDRVAVEALTGSVELPAPDASSCPDTSGDLALIGDLAVGRLVETPAEIVGTITTFVSESGTLDLTDPKYADRKVLVSGYDFLYDSADEVAGRWRCFFDELCDDPAVGSDLVDPNASWGAQQLTEGLCGDGAAPYPVANLNGHANHYSEGIPGEAVHSTEGLPALDIDGAVCDDDPLDLSGAVIYAVGCHSGLPVPELKDGEGTVLNPNDNPLDLTQTFLRRGALAYVANTGFGWGLLEGPPGYAERLVVLMTERLTAGGTVSVGEAVKWAKTRYLEEDSGCFDAYDQKSLMQWTLFGLPMVTVQTGVPAPKEASRLAPVPRTAAEIPEVERFGGVTVTRRDTDGLAPLPAFLTRLDLRFDFSAAGVYRKYQAQFDETTHQSSNLEIPDLGVPCDEVSADGCFYTLNGLATGQADLPVQPYFVYRSRLSGTSQHGVLWKGATYQEETGWNELRAVLQSNNEGGFDNLGALPKVKRQVPRPTRQVPGEDPDFVDPDGVPQCPVSDLELNSLSLPTGEVVETAEGLRERRDLKVDLEIFYFNDTDQAANNCDRDGPDLGTASSYHEVLGTSVRWTVPASDPSGVWRVVVIVDDGTVDAEGRGTWVAVELADDEEDGVWTGVYETAGAAQLSYFLQAVDQRGNVRWRLFEPPADQGPSSGIPADLPLAMEASVTPGTTDLALTLVDAFDPVAPASQLSYGIRVENLGTELASQVWVTDTPPPGTTWLASGGEGWSCTAGGGSVTCGRANLERGEGADLYLVLSAPDVEGLVVNEARVEAVQNDSNPGNDVAFEATLVSAQPTPSEPPTVAVSAAPGGTPVGGCAQVSGAVTGLRLAFSESMRAPAEETPDSVLRPASYLLLATGPDQVFSTAACGMSPASDDIVVTIDAIAYDDTTRVATLAVNGGRPLADGLYRFLACAAIRDLGDQPLDGDGDGTGGDDLVLGFRVDTFNLFANGHFDDCPPVTLAPWQLDVAGLSAVLTSSGDAGGSPLSGSAELHFAGDAVTMGQCVAVSPAHRELTLRFRFRRTASEPGTPPLFHHRCELYAEAGCAGSPLRVEGASEPVPTSWQASGLLAEAPPGTVSAFCSFGFPEAGGDSIDVEVDDLFVSGGTLIFANGFESGDLSAWSSKVP